jgi:hypothetical protein
MEIIISIIVLLQHRESGCYHKTMKENKIGLNFTNVLNFGKVVHAVRCKELKLRLSDTNKVDDERTKWQLINLIATALFIILFGVTRNYPRKRNYAI